MTDLEKAAQAVLVRWDSPAWQRFPAGRSTAALMADLRRALAAHREQQAEPVAWVDWVWDYVEPQQAEPVQAEPVDKALTKPAPQVDKEQAEPVVELDAISRALGGDAYWMDPPDGGSVTLADQVARANKAGRAFAQQQAEPVAWTTMPDADDWTFISGAQDPNGKLEGKWYALYSSPQQQAEPAVWDPQCPLCGGSRQAALAKQAEPVALRPKQHEYASYVGYTRALEAYCDLLEQAEPVADSGNPSF
jgi:hypothetical protein